MVKNPPANARDLSDVGSIPGVGRTLKKMETHSSIFGWKIPWIEEPGGLHSPEGCKNWAQLSRHTQTHTKYLNFD